jgi:hypothetical protein
MDLAKKTELALKLKEKSMQEKLHSEIYKELSEKEKKDL